MDVHDSPHVMNRLKTFSIRIVLLCCAGFAASVSAQAPKVPQVPPGLTPQEALKKMTLPAGFNVTLFAGDPDVVQPFAFCFDTRGRVWVLENLNYLTRGSDSFNEGPRGRIIILEDTDGDGRFDKKKTFADKLFFPTGLAVGHGGVWVGSPPNLYFIADKDGDDVPDAAPKVVLDGWGIQDRHETLNSFVWGPDGWLYGCHGVFTFSNVGKPGTPQKDRTPINAGVWRYHPVKDKFEVFAWGTSNPWGLDFDERGQMFITACVIPHLWHMVQGGRYHRQAGQHYDKHAYDDIKTIGDHVHQNFGGRKGGFAHGGCRIYWGGTFPAEYRGHVFMGNIHHHLLYMDKLELRDSGYRGTHGGDFLDSHDEHFLGFNLDIGPEGGLWVIDWNDADICGKAVHQVGTGRIYRVTAKDTPPVKGLDLAKLSNAELIGLHTHVNDWYPRQARRVLHERAVAGKVDKAANTSLWTLFGDTKTTTGKLRALWTLHLTGGITQPLALLESPDALVRAWAIQFICEDKNAPAAAVSKFADMAKSDPSPVVRLYLAAALQRLPLEQRWAIAENLIAHEEDKDDHNLPLMYWYAIEPLVAADKARGLKLAAQSKVPRVREFIARRSAAP